jgi:hypothetical protein
MHSLKRLLFAASILLPFSASAASSSGPRTASIVIAAADSLDKASADYVCTGKADQIMINAAIDSLVHGGSVQFRNGTYILTAPILVDRDWVTLQGEGRPHWSAYRGAYPNHALPGAPGGSKFVQTTSGQDGIHVGASNFRTEGRHKGLAFRNLYLVGQNYNGTGLYDPQATDISEVVDCAVQGFNNGIDVGWDGPHLAGNSIQDDAGFGIRHVPGGLGGTIVNNCTFDIGGDGIWASTYGDMVANNIVGDIGRDGIAVTAPGIAVTGNALQGCHGRGIAVGFYSASRDLPNYIAITGNTIVLTGIVVPDRTPNVAQDGIQLGEPGHPVTGCTVTGNSVVNVAKSSTGYAIAARAGNGNTICGNAIVGPAWNGNSAATIWWGAGNAGSGTNAGDNGPLLGAAGSATEAPLVASGTATLANGTVTISVPNVTATSLCLASVTGASISSSAGIVYPSAIMPGPAGKVTFKCANAASADTIAWKVFQ